MTNHIQCSPYDSRTRSRTYHHRQQSAYLNIKMQNHSKPMYFLLVLYWIRARLLPEPNLIRLNLHNICQTFHWWFIGPGLGSIFCNKNDKLVGFRIEMHYKIITTLHSLSYINIIVLISGNFTLHFHCNIQYRVYLIPNINLNWSQCVGGNLLHVSATGWNYYACLHSLSANNQVNSL